MPVQVNDFVADALISQLLLLDSADPTKVCGTHHVSVVELDWASTSFTHCLLSGLRVVPRILSGTTRGSEGLRRIANFEDLQSFTTVSTQS